MGPCYIHVIYHGKSNQHYYNQLMFFFQIFKNVAYVNIPRMV
jgi:hypothetical protein